MDILTIAYYTALRNFKDKRMLAIMLIMPIALIAVLGTALEGFFAPREIAKSNIAYLNTDLGSGGQQVTSYLESEHVQDFVIISYVTDLEAGLYAVEDGSVEALVYVPADFSQNLDTGVEARIQLHTPLQMPLIRGLLTNYTNTLSAQVVAGARVSPLNQDYIREDSFSTEGKTPRAIDYFAVQTLLQVMLMGGWYGIGSVQDDKEKNTIVRLATAPIRPWANLMGKITANVLVLFLQASVVMLFSKLVYGANWSGNAVVIFVTLLLFSTLTVTLGLLIAVFVSDSNKAVGALWCLMLYFSITAGAFGSTEIANWALLSPNYYAKTALFGTIFGGSPGIVQSSLLVLFFTTIVLLGAAVSFGRRKLA